MNLDESLIPPVHKYVDYIKFWKKIYEELYEDRLLTISNDDVLSKHMSGHFHKLRHIMDEDLFEWNHSMIIGLVMAMNYRNEYYKTIDASFCKSNNVFPVTENDSFCQSMLLLTSIQNRWKTFDLNDLRTIKNYVFNVHKSVLEKFTFASDLTIMNRWNLMKKVGKNLFKPNNKALMLTMCRVSIQLQQLHTAEVIKPYLTSAKRFTFNDATLQTFFKWSRGEKTYFTIRNFRNRILNIFWRFMNDEATRCYYTYIRTGEVPSIHSHVTSKYPQQWTSTVQHFILYGESHELLCHENVFIKDATLLCLWEAFMKTIYGYNFTQFCLCMDYDIVQQEKHLLISKHPVVLRVWQRWLLCFQGKIYDYGNLQETLLAWLHHVHEDCNSIVLKEISLLKICKTLCVKEIVVEKDYSNETFIEVSV